MRLWLLAKLRPCREIVRLMSDSCERDLTVGERLQVRLHRIVCAWCDRYLAQLGVVRQVIHQGSDDIGPHLSSGSMSPEARDRIANSLKNRNS